MIIKNDNYVLDVDTKATAAYYKINSVCDCAECRNFRLQAKQKFPLLTQILAEFGVDISRPDEIISYDMYNAVCYDLVAYTVAGNILQEDAYVFHVTESDVLLKVVIDNSYVPNEQQTEAYFTVTVSGFQLDWRLNVPHSVHRSHLVQSCRLFIRKLKKLFVGQKVSDTPPAPNWETIVEMMYDTGLDAFGDKVVRVIYSADRMMRYVLLKDEKGLYTYQLEAIYQFDEEERKYTCSGNNALPAMWEPFNNVLGSSIFFDEQDLLRELELEPEYKQYFL